MEVEGLIRHHPSYYRGGGGFYKYRIRDLEYLYNETGFPEPFTLYQLLELYPLHRT